MIRQIPNISSEELKTVLKKYDIGDIQHVKTFTAGNIRAPKKIIITDKGKFLLKRRQKDKNDLERVKFTHAVQMHLEEKGYAVAGLIKTQKNNTVIRVKKHVFEMLHFVSGSRYNGSNKSAAQAGEQLGILHKHLWPLTYPESTLRETFHNSESVTIAMQKIGQRKPPRGSKNLKQITEQLTAQYRQSAENVNDLGYSTWPDQIVHGDWHPGNILFDHGKVACVVDFDSVKSAPAITDVANGVLQFSITAGKPNPADWPDHLDNTKLTLFLAGYSRSVKLSQTMLFSLPDLMIETLIAEAILPLTIKAPFDHLSGVNFLKMIQRKCTWIDANRDTLTQVLLASGRHCV